MKYRVSDTGSDIRIYRGSRFDLVVSILRDHPVALRRRVATTTPISLAPSVGVENNTVPVLRSSRI